jgi:hypothetical protein
MLIPGQLILYNPLYGHLRTIPKTISKTTISFFQAHLVPRFFPNNYLISNFINNYLNPCRITTSCPYNYLIPFPYPPTWI